MRKHSLIAAVIALTLLLAPAVHVLAQGMEGGDPPIAGPADNNTGLVAGGSTPGTDNSGNTPNSNSLDTNPGGQK
ncbi:MAG: hypothetical protein HY660_11035 [Armatimonadetes bacterium]|nr:hypothetical protein [Armatimonadota bacterium]